MKNKGILAAIAIAFVIAYINLQSFRAPNKEDPQSAARSAETITRRCAVEAGMHPDDKQHKITPEEMRKMTECVDQHSDR